MCVTCRVGHCGRAADIGKLLARLGLAAFPGRPWQGKIMLQAAAAKRRRSGPDTLRRSNARRSRRQTRPFSRASQRVGAAFRYPVPACPANRSPCAGPGALRPHALPDPGVRAAARPGQRAVIGMSSGRPSQGNFLFPEFSPFAGQELPYAQTRNGIVRQFHARQALAVHMYAVAVKGETQIVEA